MGTNCSCQKIESEEETFMRIFSSMNLTDIETKSAYLEFSKCINIDDGYLDYFLFKNFLSKIVGENNYKTAQICYFENLRKMDNKKQNIKKIGSLIIILSKGSKFQKIESLYEHYLKYYSLFDEKTVKEFLNDLIEMHTDTCIQSFRENFEYDVIASMTEVYKKLRKRQLLNHLYAYYEKVKIKNLHGPQKKPSEKLNTSFDMENLLEGKDANNVSNMHIMNNINSMNITPIKKPRDEFQEIFERYNKSQCDSFRSNFTFENKKMDDDEKTIKEFIELTYNHLTGEFMRNWLYEDYLKEKSYENVCI